MQINIFYFPNTKLMKKYELFIGIDVSKLKLDVHFLPAEASLKQFHFVVENNEKGLKKILKEVEKQNLNLDKCLICFENTGVYSMPLAIFFNKFDAHYWIVPAIEIKRSKGITRGKTDKTDAKDIANYAFTHCHKFIRKTLPEQDIMKLKLLFTERDKLVKVIRMLETTEENDSFLPKEVVKDVLKINAKSLKQIKQNLKAIEEKISLIIKENSTLNEQYQLVCSVPGVGPQTATYLLIVTSSFTAFKNWRKLACYSGIAPFEYSSGSSIRGRTKVNHMADKKMKSLLNMCALNMKKVDYEVGQYYDRKIAEGKHPMSVMNAVRCKVLARVFATVERGTPYVKLNKYVA